MSAMHRAMSRAAERYRPNDYIPVTAQDEETGIFLCNDGHIGVYRGIAPPWRAATGAGDSPEI